MSDYRVSTDPELQPYCDKDGNPIVFDQEQCWAIERAFMIYERVMEIERQKQRDGAESFTTCAPAFDPEAYHELQLVEKSCLMGRLLRDGLPPLVDNPPTVHAAKDYRVAGTYTATDEVATGLCPHGVRWDRNCEACWAEADDVS